MTAHRWHIQEEPTQEGRKLSCPFEDEVLLLADGELTFARRIVVEAHLGVCDECAAIEDVLSVVEDCLVAEPIESLGAAERALGLLPEQGPRLRPFILAAAAAALVFVAVRSGADRQGTIPAQQVAREHPAVEVHADDPGDIPSVSRDHVAVADRPLPSIPPPQPPVGPTLRRRLAEVDPLARDRDEKATEIALEIRRRGRRGSRALAEILAGSDEVLVGVALSVAQHVDSADVTAAVARLTAHPLLGDLAAAQLVDSRDESAVPVLIEQLVATRSPRAREALALIGGRAASRALVRSFWVAPPDEREALLAAAVRADAEIGGTACLEAAATPREAETDGPAFDEVARLVVASRPDRLLPYLRRASAGRDALRSRVASRALGWAADEESVPELRALARSPRTASAAVAALLDIGTRDALEGAFDAALLTGSDGAGAVAFQDRFGAEWFVLETVQTGDVRQKRFALSLLARCGGPSAALALARADLPRSLQHDLVTTLGAIGGDESAAALGPLAHVPGLETAVIAALGRTGSSAAIPHLRRVSQPAPRRREAVVAALAEIESAASVAALIELLSDPRAGSTALDAVARLPVRLVVPGLLDRCDESVPLHVRRALARIAGRDLGSSPLPWREWWSAHT